MKRYLPFLLALTVLLTPISAAAQFGPIVPEVCRICPCGFGGVLAIIQNLINFLIAISIIIATLIMVWAGVMYIMSATNPESRSTANKMLMNAVIGIMIILSAWLMVDFVMKTLYGGQFGPWNTILLGGTGDSCLEEKPVDSLFSGGILAVPGQGYTGGATTEPMEGNDGQFTYQSGIAAQARHASQPLNTLLSCMAQRVPANVGQISSISDSSIANGSKTFEQCVAGGCAHSAGSCHYGGRQCTGSSFAVDFGDGDTGSSNLTYLTAAARACGADFVNPEGTHLHVSVGRSSGCSCN